MKKIIFIIISLFFVTGCYDYRELNDMSVVSGIGIDYIDNEYKVYLEIIKSTKDGSSTEIESTTLEGESTNLNEAFYNAKNMSDKIIYMEHVEVLVLSKELCSYGISNVIDYIIRDTMINNNYFIVVSDNPKEILSKEIEDTSSSEIIMNTINYFVDNTTLEDIDIIAGYLLNDRKDIAIPYISMIDDKVLFNKMAYFDGDKLKGLINNKIYSFLVLDSNNISFNSGKNTIDILSKNVSYDIGDDLITIKIDCNGVIKEIDSNIGLDNPSSYSKLEDKLEVEIENQVMKFVNDTYKDKVDLLGFKDMYYKKYKRNINNINYNVEVSLNIKKNGTIYGVVK